MENFGLIALVEELKAETEGMVVRRVIQHHRNGFLLETRSVRTPGLKMSLDSYNPLVYVSGSRAPVQPVTSDFLMILRKHLASAQLIRIEKPLSERIVEFHFKTSLPAKELETVWLVAELLPNAPNLFLLDAGRKMLGSARAPGPRREIELYEDYSYPRSRKLPLEDACGEDSSWFNAEEFQKDPGGWLIRNISGIGPVLAAELLHRRSSSTGSLPELMRTLVLRLLRPSSTVWVYAEKPMKVILDRNDLDSLRKTIVSPIELESLGNSHSVQTYPGMLEATRVVSDELESRTLLAAAMAPRIRRTRDRVRRIDQLQSRLRQRQERYEVADGIQATAQLLVASGADMDSHHNNLEVTDYAGDGPRSITIDLDSSKSLRDNVNKMFKEHRKARRGLEIVRTRILKSQNEKNSLLTEMERMMSIGNWEGWAMLAGSAKHGAPGSPSRGASAKADRSGARRRRSIRMDGHEVLIGRNSRENDELTFKVASGDDFWFHVAGYTGSHVIVRNPSREDALDDALLVRAAQLAAYYSQARNSAKVDVHYTRRKFVVKPRKARPGLVQLREFKTVSVEPHDWTKPAHSPTGTGNGSG